MLKYLLVTSSGLESGVIKKAIAQVSGFNSLGLESELILISDQLGPDLSKLYPFIKIINFKNLPRNDIFGRLLRVVSLRRSIRDVILSLDREDVLYLRGLEFQLSYYPLAFFRMGRRCRIVSEHQSIEIRQSILYGSYLSALIDLVTGGFITGQTDGIIGVTDEITDYWSGRLFCGKIPHTTIANGFDVRSVPVRTPPTEDRADLHLLFVGNVSRWHGLDRIVRGIAAYRGDVTINLHIVGEGDEMSVPARLDFRLERVGRREERIAVFLENGAAGQAVAPVGVFREAFVLFRHAETFRLRDEPPLIASIRRHGRRSTPTLTINP